MTAINSIHNMLISHKQILTELFKLILLYIGVFHIGMAIIATAFIQLNYGELLATTITSKQLIDLLYAASVTEIALFIALIVMAILLIAILNPLHKYLRGTEWGKKHLVQKVPE